MTSFGAWPSRGHASSLAVLKRFGPGNRRLLSFPTKGWTLAVDIPVVDGLDRLLDELDELVVEAGGRDLPGKGQPGAPRAHAGDVPAPREWREVREKPDPSGRFRSDLSRRLHLT